tara:strand:- start:324 stop:560 length:237 start_codon:yes stop_codon:yes gene_type:complete
MDQVMRCFVSEWISVDDRLPEIKRDWETFIVANSGDVFVGYWNRRSGKFLDEPYGMEMSGSATHWMPLPDAPDAVGAP